MDYTYEAVAKMIDHSLLHPALTERELESGCQLALDYDVASVCILPYYLGRCAEILKGTNVRASTTIGFPHGGHTTAVKLAEAKQALDDGGEELDVVCNIGKVLSDDLGYVKTELKTLTDLVHSRGQKIKVIFENSYLDEKHKIALCHICGEIGADWAKTSTGYSSSGATVDDVALMRAHCPAHVQIKAAGGVRDLDTLLAVRAAGASRCGASRTGDILDECRRRLSG